MRKASALRQGATTGCLFAARCQHCTRRGDSERGTVLGQRKLVDELRRFFGRAPHELPVVSRAFSAVELPNLQIAIEQYGKEHKVGLRVLGYVGATGRDRLSELIACEEWGRDRSIASVRYRMVDVDYDRRMQCVEAGIYLIERPDLKIAANLYETCALELEVIA